MMKAITAGLALQNPFYSYIFVPSFRLSSLNPTTLYQIYTYAKGLIYNTATIPFLSQKVNLTCCKWITQYCTPLMAQMVKNLPAMHKARVWSLSWEDPLEKAMATHSSIFARRIPWTEEPGGPQSIRQHFQNRKTFNIILTAFLCMIFLTYLTA